MENQIDKNMMKDEINSNIARNSASFLCVASVVNYIFTLKYFFCNPLWDLPKDNIYLQEGNRYMHEKSSPLIVPNSR